MRRFPPGPKSRYPGGVFLKFRQDPIGFLEKAAAQFGDIVHWKMGGQNAFLINDPNLIRDVLVTQDKKFDKQLEASRSLLGLGLTVSNGELHQRQRRSIQPGFHRDRIAKYAEVMVQCADRAQSQWQENATLEIKHEMERIALSVVGETLFGVNLGSHADGISRAMAAAVGSPSNMMVPMLRWIEKLPLNGVRAAKAGRAVMHAVVDEVIRKCRPSAAQTDDLLAGLLFDDDQNNATSEAQVHDEVMNLLIAGYETTSNAMSWAWYLLSQHPKVEDCLHQELDRVVGDRPPTKADFEALRLTQNVIRESLRLYPPLWIIWRRTLEDYPLNGYVAPAGSLVLMCQHLTHRDKRYFPEPLRFNPDRWTEEFREHLPKFAYFPFGGGSRQCLGDRFGFMEAVLVVATIARKWKLRLSAGHPVVPAPLFTLRPRYGLRMIASQR
jgi:cytochrome P450